MNFSCVPLQAMQLSYRTVVQL